MRPKAEWAIDSEPIQARRIIVNYMHYGDCEIVIVQIIGNLLVLGDLILTRELSFRMNNCRTIVVVQVHN